MRQHTNSATRLLMPFAAMAFVVGLAACGSDAPPTVTKTVTTRSTTTPAYVAPGTPVTTGTTTTQTTTQSAPQ
jgi:hypothetical protein